MPPLLKRIVYGRRYSRPNDLFFQDHKWEAWQRAQDNERREQHIRWSVQKLEKSASFGYMCETTSEIKRKQMVKQDQEVQARLEEMKEYQITRIKLAKLKHEALITVHDRHKYSTSITRDQFYELAKEEFQTRKKQLQEREEFMLLPVDWGVSLVGGNEERICYQMKK